MILVTVSPYFKPCIHVGNFKYEEWNYSTYSTSILYNKVYWDSGKGKNIAHSVITPITFMLTTHCLF